MTAHRTLLLLAFLPACGRAPAPVPADPPGTAEFTGPAESAMPNLSLAAGGRVILTWLEPVAEGRHALRLAVRSPEGGGAWSAPRTIRESDRYFVNWADFPSLVAPDAGAWVVHWLEKTAASPYAYHVLLARSTDEGATWSAPVPAHRDRSNTEHGFVSMSPRPGGGADLVWLDGRRMTDPTPGAMGVRTTSLDAAGRLGEETELDARTCECCQTALVRTSRGLLAAYRDRSAGEIRDIAVVRERGGRWSEPEIVAPDEWEHRACPVNGPALAAGGGGDRVALAWYTGAGGRPRVSLVLSDDGGERFGPRIAIDDGDPVGRVDALSLAGGAVAVVWLEGVDQETAEWRVRRVEAGGQAGPSRAIAKVSRARRSGFPRLAPAGEDLLVAFTATEPPSGVQVLRMPMEPR